MNLVFCNFDNIRHVSERYETLPEEQKSARANYLICDECRQPAFFTRKSKNGRGPFFSSRKHLEGCSLASLAAKEIDGVLQSQKKFLNDTKKIRLDLNFGAVAVNHVTEVENKGSSTSRVIGNKSDGQGVGTAHSSRRLSTLLRNLLSFPEFEKSHQILSVPGHEEKRLCDFFKRLSDREAIKDKEYLFWGRLDSYSENEYRVFLHFGGTDILIVKSVLDKLFSRYGIKSCAEMVNSYVIIFGKFENGFTRLTEINNFHFMKIA